MSAALSTTVRYWLEGVLARLGVSEARREECAACACVTVAEVTIEFLQPACGEDSYVVARAAVGELPPPGRCESLYQMVLEVQAMLCGPHTPVLGLDWPSRRLLVSASIDICNVGAEDAASILCSIQQMALQWREAIARAHSSEPAADAQRVMAHR